MTCARNYENLLNFVKIMPKILVVFFLRTLGMKANQRLYNSVLRLSVITSLTQLLHRLCHEHNTIIIVDYYQKYYCYS